MNSLFRVRKINLLVAGCYHFCAISAIILSSSNLYRSLQTRGPQERFYTTRLAGKSGHHTSPSPNSTMDSTVRFLKAQDAYNMDQELFALGYTLEQLMELAGLAVAEAVHNCLPPQLLKPRRILVVCGPGNNGGDGLVAARHLVLLGYDVTIVYPKHSTREPHYSRLVQQCRLFGIPILSTMPPRFFDATAAANPNIGCYDGIIDAIFGFSFKGETREPFKSCIEDMIYAQREFQSIIISVDVPSGWDVDQGDLVEAGFQPDVLVSLTAPKLCSRFFQGKHYIGGRFIPRLIAEKYGIDIPAYQGYDQVYEIKK